MPAQRRRQSSVAMRRAVNPGYYAEEARCGNAPKATATGFHFPSPAAVRGYGAAGLAVATASAEMCQMHDAPSPDWPFGAGRKSRRLSTLGRGICSACRLLSLVRAGEYFLASLEIPLVKPIGAAFHINITCRLVLSRGERWEMARGAVTEAPNIS